MFQCAKGKTEKADRETRSPPRSRPQEQGRSFYPRRPGETEGNLWLLEVARAEPQGEPRRLQIKVQFWAGQLAVQTFTVYGIQLGADGSCGWWKVSARPMLCCVNGVDHILHPGVERLTYPWPIMSYDRLSLFLKDATSQEYYHWSLQETLYFEGFLIK